MKSYFRRGGEGGRFVPFSVLQRGNTRMDNYEYFRHLWGITIFLLKVFLSCPVTKVENIPDNKKHSTIIKLSFLNVPGQIT